MERSCLTELTHSAVSQYDLDGPFWIPYLKARQKGGFTLDSMNVYPGIENHSAATLPQQNAIPGQTPILPTATGAGEIPIGRILNGDTPQSLTDLSATPEVPGDPAPVQMHVVPTLPSCPSMAPSTENLAASHDMEVMIDNASPNTQDDDYPPSNIVPDSQPASDVVPSSWKTEEAVTSSAG